ncbi:unnamed protein product [Paramecium sonneborni]|uniref:Cytoplasmic dynein intermediate chain n=1 Tax=Paramecium sonneborni TaxID=65129 RepID=A0A8S1LQX9_9CILI|nr:unnamed protein product [Paramecium sonneborni]
MSSNYQDKQKLLQEKKEKIARLKEEQMKQQLQIASVKQPQQVTQAEENGESKQSSQQVQPTQNQGVIAPPQQSDFISLYLQTKRKKLGFQTIEMYSNNPAPPQAEVITIEFGVQCEFEMPQQKQENDDQVIPIMENVRRDSRKKKEVLQSAEKVVEKVEKNISMEEINSIVQSQSFQRFFSRSSKTIEKAIHGGEVDVLEDLMNTQQVAQEIGKDNLTKLLSFSDKVYTENRVVTSIQWSPTLPNTFLAAYSQNEEGSITDQVGVVLLWSLQLKSRPEFYCFANSPITSACFHPFSPNVVLGGLYNGQVVVWDLRAKHTPEKRSTLNSGGHSYPIYGLSIVGSQNANNLISSSNDGRICIWNLAQLNQPQKIIDLKTKNKQQTTNPQVEVNSTCMVFPQGDANNFYVGAEDGCIYKSKLHQNTNENIVIPFEEHLAPVSGISLNSSPQASPIISNLLLSSSFDWTCKLWNTRTQSDNKCLATFECSEDYVYDVQWNGQHPSLFSTTDGEGYVDLWDLSYDLEAPITRYKSGNNSINKSQWSKDGTKIAIGDSFGEIQILQLSQKAQKVDHERLAKLEQWIKSEK